MTDKRRIELELKLLALRESVNEVLKELRDETKPAARKPRKPSMQERMADMKARIIAGRLKSNVS